MSVSEAEPWISTSTFCRCRFSFSPPKCIFSWFLAWNWCVCRTGRLCFLLVKCTELFDFVLMYNWQLAPRVPLDSGRTNVCHDSFQGKKLCNLSIPVLSILPNVQTKGPWVCSLWAALLFHSWKNIYFLKCQSETAFCQPSEGLKWPTADLDSLIKPLQNTVV